MTYYPGTTPTFTTKTNKIDLVDASHINDIQNEVIALATELGTNPSESRTTLKERLNSMMDGNGAVVGSNGFPDGVLVPSYAHQMWYRTDLDSFYIRNNANTAWTQFGQANSNVLFQYSSVVDYFSASGEILGEVIAGDATSSSPVYLRYLVFKNNAQASVFKSTWDSRFIKTQGISTVTVLAQIWALASLGGSCTLKVGVGTAFATYLSQNTTPGWVTLPIDVSALNNGTTYNVSVSLANSINYGCSCLGNLIGFGS